MLRSSQLGALFDPAGRDAQAFGSIEPVAHGVPITQKTAVLAALVGVGSRIKGDFHGESRIHRSWHDGAADGA